MLSIEFSLSWRDNSRGHLRRGYAIKKPKRRVIQDAKPVVYPVYKEKVDVDKLVAGLLLLIEQLQDEGEFPSIKKKRKQ